MDRNSIRHNTNLFIVAFASAWLTITAQNCNEPVRASVQDIGPVTENLYVGDYVTAGEVKFFSRDFDPTTPEPDCPPGWSVYDAMAGRYSIGVTTNGVLAGNLGSAYLNSNGPVRRGGSAQTVYFSGTIRGNTSPSLTRSPVILPIWAAFRAVASL